MSEDFEILYSDSKESGSHHSHHHSDGEHHSSHHHSDESHHSSHHHGSHRHSKQRKRRKRILIITLSIVACLLIAIGVGGAYGYKIAKREVADVKQQAYTLKADLKNVMAGLKAQDPVATETACDQLDVAIEDINKTFDKKIWKTAYKIPKFKGYIDSVKELLDLVQEASSDIARPTVAVLNDYPLSGLKVDDGFSITTINAYLSLLEDIEPKIDHIVTAMNQVDLPMGLNSMISDYSVQIASMTGSYDNLKEFLPLFKTFIGDGSDRTYLLAAQNSSEIRASGGFPGSIGTIRIRDGVLTIGDFSSVYKVLASYTPSAANITAEEKELFGSWMNGPRDACFDPDFERVAYIWALAYEQKNSEHVNGVVSLTPAIIQGMLEYIGNVTLSDGTELTSENATKVLQYDLYYKYLNANASATAGDYVDDLFAETAKATMSKLVSDFDVKKAGDYYKVFSDGAKNRTVMMWMEDEEEQEFVKNAGCSGGLNEDPENPEIEEITGKKKNDQADKDEFHPYRTPGRHAADGLSDHADATGLQPDDQREQGRSDGVEFVTGAGTGAVPRDHQPPLRRAGTAEQQKRLGDRRTTLLPRRLPHGIREEQRQYVDLEISEMGSRFRLEKCAGRGHAGRSSRFREHLQVQGSV